MNEELHRAESARNLKERRLETAMEIARLGAWEFDPHRGITSWDRRCLQIFGLDRTKRTISVDETLALIHEDDRDRVRGQVQEALNPDGSGIYETEYRVCRPDGTQCWVAVRGRVQWSGDRRHPIAVIGTLMDITERRQAEEALRESEERYRKLFDSIDEGYCIIEMRIEPNEPLDYRFIEVNQAFEKQSTLVDAQGRWMRELRPEHEESWFEIYRDVALTGKPVRFEHGGKALEDRWFTLYAFRIGLPEQRRVAVLFNDITARKRAEEELWEMNRTLEQRVAERTAEAEQRAEELSALAGELARTEQREQRRLAQWLHDDLQQALVAIKIQVAITLASTKKPSLRELLAKASQLIDESIGQSRLLTAELTPPILYESGLVPALAQLSRWMAEKYHLQVTLETKTDVEPENQEAGVTLFGATRELLFNVVKHAGVNEASVTVSEKDGRLLVTVEDHGLGFDPALGQGAKAGFGLLNVRERLHLIGGEFQVRSAPGQGTCITLLAPASRVPAASEAAETESSETTGDRVIPPLSSSDPEKDRPIRILLVDDHQMVRQGLAGLLENEAGFEVVGQAGDGHEAVELARQLRPDIVTMDVTMPRMNGIEATRRIKSEFPHVCIIGLSMHGEKEQAAAMLDAGAVAYVNKGGASDELLMTILNIARQG